MEFCQPTIIARWRLASPEALSIHSICGVIRLTFSTDAEDLALGLVFFPKLIGLSNQVSEMIDDRVTGAEAEQQTAPNGQCTGIKRSVDRPLQLSNVNFRDDFLDVVARDECIDVLRCNYVPMAQSRPNLPKIVAYERPRKPGNLSECADNVLVA
jgi:hypothetical protein